MKKVATFVKKYKIIICFILIFVGSFLYSKLTSSFIVSSINKEISSIELFNIDYEDLNNYLLEKGYMIEERYNELFDNYDIVATKNEEKIEIEKTDIVINYKFYNTDNNLTPFVSGMDWNDSISDCKNKMGLNIFNTGFNSDFLPPMIASSIHMGSDWILVTANDKINYTYDLSFNTSKKLNKITVGKY